MIQVAIVHYNTPELTEAGILSLRKHGGMDWPVTVFDNSDRKPFKKKKMKGVKVIDNTKGKVIDFEAELAKYPDRMELQIANGVPFAQYQQMIESSDAILDQLYSYTPAMNGLLAMSKGIINIGGGEPENYEILGEKELRPIINVQPNYDSCFEEIERLVLHPELIPLLKQQSIEYIRRYHDYKKVARRYLDFYNTL